MGTIQTYKSKKKNNGKMRYYAKVRVKGITRTKAFRTETQAQEWIDQEERRIRRELHDGTFNRTENLKLTMKDAIDRYQRERLPELSGMESWGYLLKVVEEYLGHFKLSELKRTIIVEAREKYRYSRNPPLKTSTCNRFKTAASMVLTMARIDWEWMSHNPIEGIKSYNEKVHQRDRYLKDNELLRLMAEASKSQNPFLPAVISVAIMTGYRLDTIKNLRWSVIDFESGVIRLPPMAINDHGKRGKPRPPNIPMVPKLHEALSNLKELHAVARIKSDYLFPSPENANLPWNFEKAFINAKKKAKISDFHFHDLRHTTGTYLGRMKVPLHIIQAVLGHSDPKITMKYIQHPDDIIRSEMERTFDRDKQNDTDTEAA